MYVAPLSWGLALLLAALVATGAQAQDASVAGAYTPGTHTIQIDGHDVSRCATHTPSEHEMMMVEAALERTRARLGDDLSRGGVTTIPVAFHVLRSGTAVSQGNVTDQMIADQIEVLNEAFDGTTGGANTNFRFSLATVTRTTNASWFSGCAGSQEGPMKQALAVDPASTFNIYSCNPGGGLLGFATFPWSYPESSYWHGIVVLHSSLPGGSAFPYHLGDTATHEAGHYLGLYHTFQDGCSGGDTPPGCQTGGDRVCDTAAESSPAFTCQIGRNTCSTGGPDPVTNFMDYPEDTCMNNFTAGQSSRMDVQVATYKPTLLSGGANGEAGVSAALIAGSPVPPGGGQLLFNLTFSNTSGLPFDGEYWVSATLPNGQPYGPVFGPTALSLNNGQTTTASFTASVPRRAPAGLYTVTAYVGSEYPSDVDDTASFTFRKNNTLETDLVAFADDMEAGTWTVQNRTTGATTSFALPADGGMGAVLLGAHPNPSSATTTIRYALSAPGEVELAVYNALGQRVAILAEGEAEAGAHAATLDAAGLPSGVYLYRLRAGTEVLTGRLLVAR